MVSYPWRSRSSETACVERVGQSAGGGRTLGYWHHGRKREAAASAAVLVLLCQ